MSIQRGLSDHTVDSIYNEVLANSADEPNKFVHIHGVKAVLVTLHRDRLAEHALEIGNLLDCLPEDFRENKNGCGGQNTLCANKDRTRNNMRWADRHSSIERLFDLGLAIGKVKFLDEEIYRHEYPRFVIFNEAKGIEEIELKNAA